MELKKILQQSFENLHKFICEDLPNSKELKAIGKTNLE